MLFKGKIVSKRPIHWAWVVLGSSFITLFITYSIRIGAYSVLLPEMIKDLQITKAQAGMIKSAFSLVYLLLAPLMGWLTDRIGGRRVISFFCLFLGAGTFLMGKAENLAGSVIFYSIVGIGAAATWVPIATIIQSWFGIRKRGFALGLLSSSYGLGYGLMGLILPAIVLRYNWRVGWFILGIAGFSLFVLNGLFVREQPQKMGLSPWGGSLEDRKEVTRSSQSRGYAEILKRGRFWVIGISYFAIAYGTYAVVDFIVTYGVMELKIPYQTASLFITVLAFAGIPGGILIMFLSDHIGRKKSLVIIQALIALTVLFVIFWGKTTSLLMVGMGCFGFFYAPIFPMYAACVRDYFAKEITGTVLGLMTIFYGVGMMVSPALTGHLADVTGSFRWSFGLGALTAFVAAIVIGFLRRPRESGEKGD